MLIDLHLGVHKTATTHLQRYWMLCGEASASALSVPTPEVRAHLTPVCKRATAIESQSPNLEKRLQAARQWLEQQAPARRSLVLSDENVIGNCASIFDRQSIYATALPRLTRLAEALDGHEVRLWLCVRDYSSFLRSAYCEMVRHEPFVPFRQACKKFDVEKRGWEHLVADVLQAFPKAELNCWRYESIQELRPAITAKIFNIEVANLPQPDNQRDRHSMSQMAIDLMEAVYKRCGQDTATQIRLAVAQTATGPGMPGFDPWSDDERATWKQAYEKSLAVIQPMPGVSWLG